MLSVTAPSELNGTLLSDAISAALGRAVEIVHRPTLGVVEIAEADESNRAVVEAVVADHPAQARTAADSAAASRTNESTIRDRATAALQTNRDFLALASPTNAQTLAQVKALTRQNNGLIRLVLNRFDGTD